MKFLGNVLWFFLGGALCGVAWLMAALLCCCTIIGIPLGIQCAKFGILTFFPFGKEILFGGGAVSLMANIIWLVFLGIPLAVLHACFGVFFYITIIGIPFGVQFFKLAKLSLMPFGASIVEV